jgi:hypothetical protein
VKNIRNLNNYRRKCSDSPYNATALYLYFFCLSVLFLLPFARFEIHPTSQPPTAPTSHSAALRASSIFANHDIRKYGLHFLETQLAI